MKNFTRVVLCASILLSVVQSVAQTNGTPIVGLGISGSGNVGVSSGAPRNRFSVANSMDTADLFSVSAAGVVTVGLMTSVTQATGFCGSFSTCDVDLKVDSTKFQNICFPIANNSNTALIGSTSKGGAYTIYRNPDSNTWHAALAQNAQVEVTCLIALPVSSRTGSALDYSQAEISFTSTDKNEANPQQIVVSNGGTAAITISTDTISGATPPKFSVISDSCAGVSLAPASTCSITIQPTGTDASDAADLVISDNETYQPTPIGLSATYTIQ